MNPQAVGEQITLFLMPKSLLKQQMEVFTYNPSLFQRHFLGEDFSTLWPQKDGLILPFLQLLHFA